MCTEMQVQGGERAGGQGHVGNPGKWYQEAGLSTGAGFQPPGRGGKSRGNIDLT